MPTILTAIRDESGRPAIAVHNPDAAARTGRWCKAPLVPDRCDNCWDPETLAHYEAEGYTEDADGWRFGTCHRCAEKRGRP